MTKEKILIGFLLIILIIVSAINFLPSIFKNTTTVTIRNHTSESIQNLKFASIDNEEVHNISIIKPNTNVSFEYDIGGLNENAVVLKHLLASGNNKTYSIIGYVDSCYANINIDIISISSDGKLNIKVEA